MEQVFLNIATPPNIPAVKNGETVLAADVGGTKCALGIYVREGGNIQLQHEQTFSSQEYESFTAVLREFIGAGDAPKRLSIAFAGPVQDGKAYATNLGWSLDAERLKEDLGFDRVSLINDLEGAAYGLAVLKDRHLTQVYGGKSPYIGNAGIVAPGTGLGEAGLYWDGEAHHPFATEGGHTDFSPRNPLDWELLLFLQKKYGHVSWERVLSGPGIYHIFDFLRTVKKRPISAQLAAALEVGDSSAAISAAASNAEPVGLETLHLFMRYLAVESSNLALTLNATGGIFLAGGILPKIWNNTLQNIFTEHFIQVGRLRPLIESVPVYLINHLNVVRIGAAFYAIGEQDG